MTKEISTTSDNVMDFDFFDFSDFDPIDLKKEAIAADLCALMAFKNISRSELAKKLDWKLSQLSKVLSGKQNLTIGTISKVCFALDYDFQISFHEEHEQLNVQPWERDLPTIVNLKDDNSHKENWYVLYKKQSPLEVVIDILQNEIKDYYLSPVAIKSYTNDRIIETKGNTVINPVLKQRKLSAPASVNFLYSLNKDLCNA